MWLKQLGEWTRDSVPCALATIIETTGSTPRGPGAKMVVNEKDEIAGTVGGGAVEHACRRYAREAIRTNQCIVKHFSLLGDNHVAEGDDAAENAGACGGTVTVFIEPMLPRAEIVIFGAGHIGEKIGQLCNVLNIPYRVYDDRPERVNETVFPGAAECVLGPFPELSDRISLSNNSFCVILTHGHEYDEACLRQLLANDALPYIGMIGSAVKVGGILERVRADGLVVNDRVYTPVGLKIGSHLPEEIALSIIAEIVLLMKGGKLEHFRIPPRTEGDR